MFGRVLNKIQHESQHFHTLALMNLKLKEQYQLKKITCGIKYSLFLVNWCQKWFEFFPNPPISILSIVEKLVAHHDAALLDHFVQLDVSTIVSISLRKPASSYFEDGVSWKRGLHYVSRCLQRGKNNGKKCLLSLWVFRFGELDDYGILTH